MFRSAFQSAFQPAFQSAWNQTSGGESLFALTFTDGTLYAFTFIDSATEFILTL